MQIHLTSQSRCENLTLNSSPAQTEMINVFSHKYNIHVLLFRGQPPNTIEENTNKKQELDWQKASGGRFVVQRSPSACSQSVGR